MLDELSLPKVLPVGTIVFQTLFLLVAIPIESYILHRAIKFDKKTSVFYAIGINVLSTVLGWNVFFLLEPILPVKLKSELMSYVFFNTFQGNLKTNLFLFSSCLLSQNNFRASTDFLPSNSLSTLFIASFVASDIRLFSFSASTFPYRSSLVIPFYRDSETLSP